MRVIVVAKPEDVPRYPVDGKPTLVYWNILGLAQTLRLALVCAGVDDFVDVRIDPGDPLEAATYKQAWMKAKPGLGETTMPFPNLPYYLDPLEGADDGSRCVALSQSDTILRYIGRKYNLMGDPSRLHVVDMALDELKDCISQVLGPSYGGGPKAVAAWYENSAAAIVSKWKKLLDDKDWLSGTSQPCVADVKLYSFLHQLVVIKDKLGLKPLSPAEGGDWMESYTKQFENLEAVQKYSSSPQFLSRPLNNPHAKFNN